MGTSSYSPQRHVARMAELLLLWERGSDVFKSESLRLRSRSSLPSPPSHDHTFAGDAPILARVRLRKIGGPLVAAGGDVLRVHVPKSVGKPDAVIPHVRFDERGLGTGRLPFGFVPRPPSTLPLILRIGRIFIIHKVRILLRSQLCTRFIRLGVRQIKRAKSFALIFRVLSGVHRGTLGRSRFGHSSKSRIRAVFEPPSYAPARDSKSS